MDEQPASGRPRLSLPAEFAFIMQSGWRFFGIGFSEGGRLFGRSVMFGQLGLPEMLIIMVIALLIFAPV